MSSGVSLRFPSALPRALGSDTAVGSHRVMHFGFPLRFPEHQSGFHRFSSGDTHWISSALPRAFKPDFVRWSVWMDSNHRPHTTLALFLSGARFMRAVKATVLPILRLVGLDGLEPSTSRLSGARSNHLSYRPFLSPSGFPFASICPFAVRCLPESR